MERSFPSFTLQNVSTINRISHHGVVVEPVVRSFVCGLDLDLFVGREISVVRKETTEMASLLGFPEASE